MAKPVLEIASPRPSVGVRNDGGSSYSTGRIRANLLQLRHYCVYRVYFIVKEVRIMKALSNICLAGGIAVSVLGLLSKFVLKTAIVQPASYLFVTQILILLSINFALREILKKK